MACQAGLSATAVAGFALATSDAPLRHPAVAVLRTRFPPRACVMGGRTPLHAAAEAGAEAEVVALAADSGGAAALNAPDDDGETPLQLAVLGGHPSAVAALLRAGADGGRRCAAGCTPLHDAAAAGAAGVVAALIAAAVDVAPRTPSGRTPLHAAAAGGHLHVVAALLRAGAPADAADADGRTPEAVALAGGHTQVAAALSAAGGGG